MQMTKILTGSLICLSTFVSQAKAETPITTETHINVLYPIPYAFSKVQQEIAKRFMEVHPNIKINLEAPAKHYADLQQQLLRSTLTHDEPDVAFIGLNTLRQLVDRDLPIDLEPLAKADGGFRTLGYIDSMVALGQMNGTTYALPFAISTPVLYVNQDLVEAAGGSMDNFPSTWDGILKLAQQIKTLPSKPGGMSFQWDSSGNWLIQALANSHGGHMTNGNGCKVLFEGKGGKWAFSTLYKFHNEGMEFLTYKQSRSAFNAGKMGIVAGSTSYVAQVDKIVGNRFKFRTMPWPDVIDGGGVPTGGASVIILTKDKNKQKAAWEFVKFATGAVGQTLMATYTGYGPSNQIPVNDQKMLGGYYKKHPNQLTSVNQMSIAQPWESWSGPNGIKITDVIKNKVESILSGNLKSSDVPPKLTEEVLGLLPKKCPATIN